MGSPATIRHQLANSHLTAPVLSAAFRRLARPTAKLSRRLTLDEKPFDFSNLVRTVNAGRLTKALERVVPKDIPSVDDLAKKIQPQTFPQWLRWLITNRLLMLGLPLMLLLLLGLFTGAWLVAVALAVAAAGGFFWLQRQHARTEASEALTDP